MKLEAAAPPFYTPRGLHDDEGQSTDSTQIIRISETLGVRKSGRTYKMGTGSTTRPQIKITYEKYDLEKEPLNGMPYMTYKLTLKLETKIMT